jgi:hypothetical protein
MKTIAKFFALVIIITLSINAPVSANHASYTQVKSLFPVQPLNELESFFLKNKKNVLKSNEWQIFTSVVTLYNENNAAFMQLSAAQKNSFTQAVAKLNNQLSKIKTPESIEWSEKMNEIAQDINISWNFDARKFVPVVNEAIESASIIVE